MIYIKTFLVCAPILTIIYHFMSEDGLPWWPDSILVGLFTGGLAAFALMRSPLLRKGVERLDRFARRPRGLPVDTRRQ